MKHSVLGTSYCAATATNRVKLDENQDCCGFADNQQLNLQVIAVADGLGSYEYSEVASKFAVSYVLDYVHNLGEKSNLKNLFLDIKLRLQAEAKKFESQHGVTLNPDNTFGTTLIVAIEEKSRISVGYVGNGAIWHLRGNFNHFAPTKYLPWNALNYLNPHSLQNAQGKEALYRLLSLNNNQDEALPTIFTIEKDNLLFGDILMICTDGVYSTDQVPVGKLSDGSLWINGTVTMPLFYQALNQYFSEDFEKQTLQVTMQNYLDSLAEQHILEDDASLAMIISNKAVEYQQQRLLQRTENK